MQLGEKVMAAGKLFSLSFYPSSPFLLATGGDKGVLALWDLQEIDGVLSRFGGPSNAEEVSAVTQGLETMSVAAEDKGKEKEGKKEKDKEGGKKKKKAGK